MKKSLRVKRKRKLRLTIPLFDQVVVGCIETGLGGISVETARDKEEERELSEPEQEPVAVTEEVLTGTIAEVVADAGRRSVQGKKLSQVAKGMWQSLEIEEESEERSEGETKD